MDSIWLKNKVLVSFSIASLIFSLQLFANTEIKGLAELEQLSKPIYLAAVTGEPPSSPESFEEKPTAFTMHARYVIEKYSARRNSQLWLNAILVSTSREEIQKMERAVLYFKTIVRNTMYKGDELKFALDPLKGTRVFLNGIEIAVIKEPEFQYALVRYWFGQRIASNRFAEKIRMPPKLSALKSFNSLTPDLSNNNRIPNIRSKLNSLVDEKSRSSDNPVKVAKVNSNLNQRKQQTKISNASNKQKKKTKSTTLDASKSKKVKPNRSRQKANKENNNIKKESSKDKKNDAKRENAIKKGKGVQTALKSNRQASSSVVDQLYKELKDDYIQELIDYIQLNAKPVPSRKIRKKPKGNARIRLSIAYNNERMSPSNLLVVEGNFNESLTQSLFKSISNLKKIPIAPEAIKNESFNIEVSLNFDRCKRSTSAWICL